MNLIKQFMRNLGCFAGNNQARNDAQEATHQDNPLEQSTPLALYIDKLINFLIP
jgi:hypothetical protein